jgi:hypothetical protein
VYYIGLPILKNTNLHEKSVYVQLKDSPDEKIVIDITGSGDNTLKLNLDDLLDASTSTNILKVLALKTSIPPLPVRVSLPAPATKISFLLVVVLVRVLSSLLPR